MSQMCDFKHLQFNSMNMNMNCVISAASGVKQHRGKHRRADLHADFELASSEELM